MQRLQVDDVIPIFLPAVYCSFGRCGYQRFAWWHYLHKVNSSCGFQQGDIIGIIPSTCRHCTLSNSIICSDSYPIPILSLIFLYHPYIPYFFLVQRSFLFYSLLPFLLHACMYSQQVYNSNGGLAPKIGLYNTWARLDGYSYEQALSHYVKMYFPMLTENAVVCMKSTLSTNSYVQKYLPLFGIVIVYMCITLFLTLKWMLGHQSLGVCEVSDPYPLHCYVNYIVYKHFERSWHITLLVYKISDLYPLTFLRYLRFKLKNNNDNDKKKGRMEK